MKKILPGMLFILLFIFSCKKDTLNSDAAINKILRDTQKVVTAKPAAYVEIGTSEDSFAGEVLLNQNTETKFTTRTWQGIPSVVMSDNNVLYSVWYSGGTGEGPGNYLTVSISLDKGKSWANNAMIVNPTDPAIRFFDPILWKDKYGNVNLGWTQSRGNWDGIGGVWYTRLTYTTALSFTKPKKLADGVMMNKPNLSVDGLQMFYPIAVWNYTQKPDKDGINVYETSFNPEAKLPSDFNLKSTIKFDAKLRNFDEHEIVQLKDRSFIGFIRGVDGIYKTRSTSQTTWETPQKFTELGATNSSRFYFGRLHSGKLCFVFNNSASREKMTICLSDDEGATWKYKMIIEAKTGVSYPDLTEDAQGNIYVIYDYNRYSNGVITCAMMTENDIMTNATANVKKYEVHKLK